MSKSAVDLRGAYGWLLWRRRCQVIRLFLTKVNLCF